MIFLIALAMLILYSINKKMLGAIIFLGLVIIIFGGV